MSDDRNIFPFRIPIELNSGVSDEDNSAALREFVRLQIEALLDIVILTSGGKPVDVDGFLWMKDAFKQNNKDAVEPFPVLRED